MRLTALLFLPTSLLADINLAMPLDCTLDDTCYIQQFVDHDPGPGASDYSCGSLSYDGHKGTDFALPSLAAQAAGVNVLAAAPGTVRGTRNDMIDALQFGPDAPDVTGRECGNGLVIAHADGYETQYCHLAQGSVIVRPGDTVKTGDVLGRVGLSGETQFPHLHLSLRQNGEVIDPFDPDRDTTCAHADTETLWSTPLSSPPGGIISSGWSNDVPDFDAIKAGTAGLTQSSPDAALVAWIYLFGTRDGDRLEVALTGPTDILTDTILLDRTQAQAFRAFGKRAPGTGWPTGTYTATLQHYRGDTLIDSQTAEITVAP